LYRNTSFSDGKPKETSLSNGILWKNLAAGNQQKHLALSFSAKAQIYLS